MTQSPSAQPQPTQEIVKDSLREGLTLICLHFGHTVSQAELTDGLPLNKGLLPWSSAPKALRRLGISARVIAIAIRQLNNRLLPALLQLKDGSCLLLVSINEKEATVRDPLSAGGVQKISLIDLQAAYTGTAILARPQYRPDERAQDFAQPLGKHWLKDALKAQWRDYMSVALAALMANLLAVAGSLFALQVYDRVVPNNAFETLWLLAFGALIAMVFEFVLRNLRAHTLEILGKRIDLQMSSNIFAKVMQMRLQARPSSIGAFSNQIKEFESVRDFFTSTTAATISDIPFVLLFIGILYIIGGPVAWVPLIAALLILLIGLLSQGKLASLSRQNLREGAIKSGILLETLTQLETVKTTRAQGRLLDQWERLSAQLAATAVQSRTLTTALGYSAGLLQQLSYVGVVIVGVYLISEGEMTTGALVACTMLAGRATAPIAQIAGLLTRWQHVKVAIEGLDSIMSLPQERKDGHKYAHKPMLQGAYRLTEVQSRYNEDSPLVLDINALSLEPGEKIALLGNNGAGKSTLLRCLAGLWSPSQGQITLDGLSITQIDPADLRQNIGYLPQDVGLFYGSLRDNLTPQNDGQTDEEMLQALDAVGLGEFVRKHARGLDMLIVDNQSVSGGQRQAIGLARLLLQDPRIVLLDEPTAAFDQTSEERVIAYLQRWLSGRTLIVSTHKRALLSLTERAIVMRNGKVAMDGSLAETLQGNAVHLTDKKQ